MKTLIISALALIGVTFIACKQSKGKKNQFQATSGKITVQEAKTMKNLVSIIEIPTSDFSRAVKFYEILMDLKIEEVEMGDIKMGVFPSEKETVNLALVHGSDYKPTAEGAIVYLNSGNDLEPMLNRAVRNGGKLIVPKTEISPEMGFFAIFIDTEGNKIGLHSDH